MPTRGEWREGEAMDCIDLPIAQLGTPATALCLAKASFCTEEDDVSMSSAAAWGRRVLLRVRMLGAY